jgi:hypothetical protein
MPRRLLASAATALLAMTLLTGCSRAPWAQVGVRKTDNGAELVFALCRGARVGDFGLTEEKTEQPQRWHASGGPDAPVVSSVRIPVTPEGWIAAQETLTELRPEASYAAWAQTGGGDPLSELSGVTIALIEALTDGQVLGRGEQGVAVPMTYDDFRAQAGKACHA